MARIRTVERDSWGGWIARNPFTGAIIGGDDFRWNSRSVARTVVYEARMFDAPPSRPEDAPEGEAK